MKQEIIFDVDGTPMINLDDNKEEPGIIEWIIGLFDLNKIFGDDF